jgi:Zn-finger nucleic acid-binding protein
LLISERQGIEIDYCPTCRGVWLDRGELDKIIERSTPDIPPAREAAPAPERRRDDYDPPRRDRYDSDDARYYPKKKKSGFLGDLFDF